MSSLRDAVEDVVEIGSPGEQLHELEGAAPAARGSVLEAVRARAQQLQTETTVELPIPGYQNLVGSYAAISITQFFKITGGELRNPLTDWGVAADALATALVSLYGIDEHGQLVDLYESGDPARYDDELLDALGLHAEQRTARAALVAVFGGGKIGQSRAWSHFLSYQNWLMEGPAQEVAGDAAGES